MMFKAKFAVVWLSVALMGGCTSSIKNFSTEITAAGGRATVLQTTPFPLLAAVKKDAEESTTLRVYIEDDGSKASESQGSTNPTPKALMLVKLALNDPAPSAYLARPCQYVWSERCVQPELSERRFSSSVITSYQEALEFLKGIHHNQTFELVGYGGGGAVALLLAATRTDVIRVQTLGGNLTPTTWSRLHQMPPLKGSIDPIKFAKKLQIIPQRHLVGKTDMEVPQAVAEAYMLALPEADCLEVTLVEADHSQGWDEAWGRFRDQPVRCRRPDFVPSHSVPDQEDEDEISNTDFSFE
ncbi:alpha/beta hydrolase [Pseudomonas koreensis]|uniref:alpha/beta hydrolase n=1 Tax=Pseudomonas koreensis TaxID=198620 RepID=UPI001B31E487|nr:alpha/beta hydrolase [Pseudomonas koreensis]MBP3998206.1 alpha/beta hydrolase [Pseudomonas koreensis]